MKRYRFFRFCGQSRLTALANTLRLPRRAN